MQLQLQQESGFSLQHELCQVFVRNFSTFG